MIVLQSLKISLIHHYWPFPSIRITRCSSATLKYFVFGTLSGSRNIFKSSAGATNNRICSKCRTWGYKEIFKECKTISEPKYVTLGPQLHQTTVALSLQPGEAFSLFVAFVAFICLHLSSPSCGYRLGQVPLRGSSRKPQQLRRRSQWHCNGQLRAN